VSGSAARLVRLAIRNFRNLTHLDLTVPPDGLVVIGENGQGKTNLLESIHYLQILRSVRGARDQDLVRFGADGFHVGARVETDGCHDVGVGFERAGKQKRVRLDGSVPERLSDALGALPSVMFSPADVELVAGAPSVRRRFLDIMLALTVPGYLSALQRYRAALARRNAALRGSGGNTRGSDAGVAVWEPPLAEHGAVLWAERRGWVDAICARFEALCRDIGETSRICMRYSSTLKPTNDPVSSLALALRAERAHDVRRGLTHAGPHRDDVVLTLDARELRTFGSAGQQRTAAIALRLLEAATFSAHTGRAPVFLLDDPFAELDTRRSARILGLLQQDGLGQTILAVPREGDIPPQLTRLNRMFVADGALSSPSVA
jgi:DNA replication and repair protein RecF